MAYTVAQRTREMACGGAWERRPATSSGFVFGRGFRLVGLGLVLGVGGCSPLAPDLRSALRSLRDGPGPTFLAVALVTGGGGGDRPVPSGPPRFPAASGGGLRRIGEVFGNGTADPRPVIAGTRISLGRGLHELR